MDRAEWKEWLEDKISQERSAVFFAYDSKTLVGMAYIHARNIPEDGEHIAEVSDVGVLPEYSRKGVATKLMDEVLKFAGEQGIVRMQLETWADNKPAIELYKKLGFKEEGYFEKVSKSADGTFRDSVIMAKILP
jgi:ribosomal protein S18 acetylase RimI-like enzyme